MRAEIDRSGCISCGICTQTCPEVFEMADDGLAQVHTEEVPDSCVSTATEARENCPTSVISLED